MEVKRSLVKIKVHEICEHSREEPVFLTLYGKITNVVMSKKMYDEWEEIVKKYKESKK